MKMADSKVKNEATSSDTGTTTRATLGIRLAPVDNSDLPVVANYAQVNAVPGMTFVDFGFLEPAMLNALPRVAKQGGKLPESINGKLAVRVALSYEAAATLHQQLGRLLTGLGAAAAAARQRKPG
jgi:hypothetical protein